MNPDKRRETIAKATSFVGDLFSQPQGFAIARACGFTHTQADFWAFHADVQKSVETGAPQGLSDRIDLIRGVLKVAARAYQEFLADPPTDGTREDLIEIMESLQAVNQLLRERPTP